MSTIVDLAALIEDYELFIKLYDSGSRKFSDLNVCITQCCQLGIYVFTD